MNRYTVRWEKEGCQKKTIFNNINIAPLVVFRNITAVSYQSAVISNKAIQWHEYSSHTNGDWALCWPRPKIKANHLCSMLVPTSVFLLMTRILGSSFNLRWWIANLVRVKASNDDVARGEDRIGGANWKESLNVDDYPTGADCTVCDHQYNRTLDKMSAYELCPVLALVLMLLLTRLPCTGPRLMKAQITWSFILDFSFPLFETWMGKDQRQCSLLQIGTKQPHCTITATKYYLRMASDHSPPSVRCFVGQI